MLITCEWIQQQKFVRAWKFPQLVNLPTRSVSQLFPRCSRLTWKRAGRKLSNTLKDLLVDNPLEQFPLNRCSTSHLVVVWRHEVWIFFFIVCAWVYNHFDWTRPEHWNGVERCCVLVIETIPSTCDWKRAQVSSFVACTIDLTRIDRTTNAFSCPTFRESRLALVPFSCHVLPYRFGQVLHRGAAKFQLIIYNNWTVKRTVKRKFPRVPLFVKRH